MATTQFCKSPNRCFQQDFSKKYHPTLHDAFQKAPAEEHEADSNITVGMPTHKSNEVYLQINPVLISCSTSKREKAYTLLDIGSQNTLIREDFAAELELHWNKTKIKMNSIKDQQKNIIIHETDLKIPIIVNNKMFEAWVHSFSQ